MRLLPSILRILALAWLGALASSSAALAASLEVTPVLHELQATASALGMTVSNRGDAPVTVQVRGFAWTQEGGEDRLVPADSMVVSPVIFTLAPGRSQVVRALLNEAPAATERSYRMLIDELPSGDGAQPVRFALRISVPVFRLGAGPQAAVLHGKLEDDGSSLTVTNSGGRRARVRELSVLDAGGRMLATGKSSSPYVLSGAKRSWRLSERIAAPGPGERLILSAITDSGRVEVPLEVPR